MFVESIIEKGNKIKGKCLGNILKISSKTSKFVVETGNMVCILAFTFHFIRKMADSMFFETVQKTVEWVGY